MKLLDRFLANLDSWTSSFKQSRTHRRLVRVLTGLLASTGRRTITNSIMAQGHEQEDWSADYKLFNRSEWSVRDLFASVLLEGVRFLDPDEPVVIAMDDTSLPKTGIRIPQARYCHDPLAPKFLDMQIRWGLRMLHAALLITDCNARPLAVSTAFEPVPAERKPKGIMSPTEEAAFEARKQASKLTTRSVDLIRAMRRTLDGAGMKSRQMLLVVDGSFTNGAVVKGLPHHTNLIGRFRKDSIIYAPLQVKDGKRIYGDRLPTPQQIKDDPSIPIQEGTFHYGGSDRQIRFKEGGKVLWKNGTKGRLMRLLIVMPIPYSVPGQRKNRYNLAAYLLTTDHATSAQDLIQAYLNRWQIEVLHRELKTVAGVGQVQASSEGSNDKVHGAQAAAFAMLNLAGQEVYGGEYDHWSMPLRPKWRNKDTMRISSLTLLTMFRNDLVKSGYFADPGSWKPKGWILKHRETYTAA